MFVEGGVTTVWETLLNGHRFRKSENHWIIQMENQDSIGIGDLITTTLNYFSSTYI